MRLDDTTYDNSQFVMHIPASLTSVLNVILQCVQCYIPQNIRVSNIISYKP